VSISRKIRDYMIAIAFAEVGKFRTAGGIMKCRCMNREQCKCRNRDVNIYYKNMLDNLKRCRK